MNATQKQITEAHSTGACSTDGRTCTCATAYKEAGAVEVSSSAARTLQFFLGHQETGLRNVSGAGYHMELLEAGLIALDTDAEDTHRYRITETGRMYLEDHHLAPRVQRR